MSVTNYQELFDFDGYEKRITQLVSTTDKAFQNISQAMKPMSDSVMQLKADMLELQNVIKTSGVQSFGSLSKKVNDTTAEYDRYKKALDLVKDAETLHARTINELKAGITALKGEYNKLDPATDGFAESQRSLAEQTKLVTATLNTQEQTMKSALKSVGEYNNSYKQLSRQTAGMKNDLRSLSGAFDLNTGALNKNNAQAVQLQRQISINDKALKKMDASMGNHQRNVGNYASAFSGLRSSLISVIGPALGFVSAYEAIAKTIEVIDQFDRLSLGLQTVSKDSVELAERWKFLNGIADSTGQEITKLASNYTNFVAASKNTKLEGAATDKIFKSFSGSFSALGKSSVQAERGLYAVQQMMSKGKISSEELNQQLAEVLPGANKLFADALKVSTSELASMLKQGKVLTEDVLPIVADQLEKVYGERAGKNIETISGSWSRLTNQFKLFIDKMNSTGAISGFFSSMNNGLADLFKSINGGTTEMSGLYTEMKRVADIEKDMPKLLERYDTLKDKTNKSTEEQKELFKITNEINNILPGSATKFDEWGNAIEISKSKVESLTWSLKGLLLEQQKVARTSLIKDINKSQSTVGELSKNLASGTKTQQVDLGLGQFQSITTKLSPKETAQIKEKIKLLNSELNKSRVDLFKVGGKEQFLEEEDAMRELEKRAVMLRKQSKEIASEKETFANQNRSNNKSFRLEEINEEIKLNDTKLKLARKNVTELAGIYKQYKYQTADPSVDPTKPTPTNTPTGGNDSGSKSDKRILTEYEKFLKEVQLLQSQLTDQALKAAQNGEAFVVSDKTKESWNNYYAILQQVSDTIGETIPADIKKLNGLLNQAPIATPALLQTGGAPVDTRSQKEKDAFDQRMTTNLQPNTLSATIGRQATETKGLTDSLDKGSFKRFSDDAGIELQAILAKIHQMEFEAMAAVTDDEKNAVKERINAANEEYRSKVELARQEVQVKKQYQQELINLAQQGVEATFQILSDQRSAESDMNNAYKEKELEAADGNADAQDRINEKYAKKELALKQKQARADKAQAVFSIALNTIKAVAAASPVVPLMVFAAAAGAIQLAAALAKPIPQFWKGTDNAPEGLAEVAERGPEIRESKGKRMLYTKPTVAYLNKGDKIFTASKTRELMEQSLRQEDINTITQRSALSQRSRESINKAQIALMMQPKQEKIDYTRLENAFMRAFDSRPSQETIYDEKGVRRRTATKNGTTEYLNERFKL